MARSITERLEAIEGHLDVAGVILGEAGPLELSLGSEDRARALAAVAAAWGLVEELLTDMGTTGPAD